MLNFVKIVLLFLLITSSVYSDIIKNDTDVFMENQGIIRGSVKNNLGLPVSGAKIIFYTNDHQAIDSVATDRSGKYSYHLRSGKYYVSAEAFNYIKLYFPNKHFISSAASVTIHASQIHDVSFCLEVGSSILGQIMTGINDESSFLVSAVKIDYPHKGWQRDKYCSVTYQGSYILDGLIPGYYVVFIRSSEFKTIFYNNAYLFDDAEILQSTLINPAYGIDFQLESPGNGYITGLIYESTSGDPLSNCKVSAYQWKYPEDDPYQISTETDSRGYYELEVTAGYYYIKSDIENEIQSETISLFYQDRFDPKLADMIFVEPLLYQTDIDFQIDKTLHYNLDICGTIVNQDNGMPIENAKITALDYHTGQPIAYTYSNYHGDFAIKHALTGSYILEISGHGLIPNFWPNAISWQDAEVVTLQHRGSIIQDGGAITQDYGTPGFSISGSVIGIDGPLDNVRIYAINNDNSLITYQYTNNQGDFSITSGLTEGSYSLFADLYGYNGSYYPSTLHLDLIENPDLTDINFYLETALTSIQSEIHIPDDNILLSNYPNPFNSTTIIQLSSANYLNTKVDIYNICGQLINSLPISISPGVNQIQWNGLSHDNTPVSSGIYYYKLSEFPNTHKMLLLK
jgi:hypothetical protein